MPPRKSIGGLESSSDQGGRCDLNLTAPIILISLILELEPSST